MRALQARQLLGPLQQCMSCCTGVQAPLTVAANTSGRSLLAAAGPAQLTPDQPRPSGPPDVSAWGSASSSGRLAAWGPAPQQLRGFFGSFSSPTPKVFDQRRLVGWSPEQMYAVVSDVDQYSKFVPWCQKSAVTKRTADGTYIEAELEVGFQLLVERYISQVTLKPPSEVASRVEASMLFHHCDSRWVMTPGPSPNTCWLSFHVDFAFNSALYGHLADVFFSEVVQRMVAAFESRCQTMYGPSSLIKVSRLSGQSRAPRAAPRRAAAAVPGRAVAQAVGPAGRQSAGPISHRNTVVKRIRAPAVGASDVQPEPSQAQ